MSGHVYDYQVDLNGDSAPARIIRMCGKDKRVLEIGSGPGSISRVLSAQMGCDVVCFERDELAVEKLRENNLRVVQGDLEDPNWYSSLSGEAAFGVVIIADVLEHLSDPLPVLKTAATLLDNGGCILLSIPNIGHKGVIASLLRGNFNYQNYGLLDRTHIRFFCVKNIEALIEQAALSVKEAEYVLRSPEETELAAYWDDLSPVQKTALENVEFGDVYQVVARLMKKGSAIDTLSNVRSAPALRQQSLVKLIAFYLPQFHPTDVNDQAWGKGFTEWRNVTKATPLFQGHYQPHLPGELGFYDLRLRDARREQEKLAREFGIHGFCYHFYWFSGRRVLELPLNAMLADSSSDMPFCICWANENWTRRWDGQDKEVILEQLYLPEDDENCIRDMLPYLRDQRYIRYNSRPLIIIYNPLHLRDAKSLSRCWRKVCQDEGLGDPYLVGAQSHGNLEHNHTEFGLDASVEFPPHNLRTWDLKSRVVSEVELTGWIRDYVDIAEEMLAKTYAPSSEFAGFRTVIPSWDNTARVGNRAGIVVGASPDNYEVWLDRAIRKTASETRYGDSFVFINAWNEWAEGAHLEPDLRYGRRYLEATRRAALSETSQKKHFSYMSNNASKSGEMSSSGGDLLASREQDLFERMAAAETEATKLGVQVGRMYGSLSWRLTAPVRSILNKFGVPELGDAPPEE